MTGLRVVAAARNLFLGGRHAHGFFSQSGAARAYLKRIITDTQNSVRDEFTGLKALIWPWNGAGVGG